MSQQMADMSTSSTNPPVGFGQPPTQQQDGLEAHPVRLSAHSCGNENHNASFIQNYRLTRLAKMRLIPHLSVYIFFLFPHLFIVRIIQSSVLIKYDVKSKKKKKE